MDANDNDDVHVASKPNVILLLAQLIAFNCFASGLLWMAFLSAPRRWRCCKGVNFRMSIVSVDQISYLLYALFPLLSVVLDSYNRNTDDIRVILGQLSVDRIVPVLSTAVPLLFLCQKCLVLTINARSRLRNAFYCQWLSIQDIISSSNDQHTVILARAHGIDLDEETLRAVQGEIFDSEGKLISSVLTRNRARDDDAIGTVPTALKALLSFLSAMYIVFAVVLLVLVTGHFSKSHEYCNSIVESKYVSNDVFIADAVSLSESQKSVFMDNPELLVWDFCRYQVLPWTTDDVHRCQCRVFVIDWDRDLKSLPSQRMDVFQVTAQNLFDGIFSRWTMLEKFKTVGLAGLASDKAFIWKDTFPSRSILKAFEWHDIVNAFQFLSFSDIHFLKEPESLFFDLLLRVI